MTQFHRGVAGARFCNWLTDPDGAASFEASLVADRLRDRISLNGYKLYGSER